MFVYGFPVVSLAAVYSVGLTVFFPYKATLRTAAREARCPTFLVMFPLRTFAPKSRKNACASTDKTSENHSLEFFIFFFYNQWNLNTANKYSHDNKTKMEMY